MDKTLSFHRSPPNEKRRRAWIIAVRQDRKAFYYYFNLPVCAAHLTEDNFQKTTSIGSKCHVRRLVSTAVPSVFAWNDFSKNRPPRRRVFIRHAPVESARRKLEKESKRASLEVLQAKDAFACHISDGSDRHPTPAPHPDHDSYTRRQDLHGAARSGFREKNSKPGRRTVRPPIEIDFLRVSQG